MTIYEGGGSLESSVYTSSRKDERIHDADIVRSACLHQQTDNLE